jgi:hypothetical protein
VSVDWVAWHEEYADPGSPLSRRLLVVQEQIRRALPARRPSGRLRVISLCAGRGEDLIGVLARYPHRERVWVRMVELDGVNVAAMRARARAAGVQLDIVQVDAAQSSVYAAIAPADLVLVCGVFGNISPEDVGFTIRSLPQLCRTGATVIWTRSRRPPDLTPQIRRWLAGAGFEETAFVAPDGMVFSVGSSRFLGVPQPLGRDRLFSFRR